MKNICINIINKISNPKIFVIIISWMIILVFIGTISQKYIGLYASQNKYFFSKILWFGYLPLPGGLTTMILMSINLSSFFFKKNIWNKKKFGIITVHLGTLLLLYGGGITYFFNKEGSMILTTKQTNSNYIQSYHDKEFVIIDIDTYKDSLEFINFNEQSLKPGKKITYDNIPFEIEIIQYCQNSILIEDTDSPSMECINSEIEDSENKTGIQYYLKSTNIKNNNINGTYISRVNSNNNSENIVIDDKRYIILLQPKRTYLPFTIELINVNRTLYPNSQIPKSYSSEINVLNEQLSRRDIIEMNAPLRYKGYTFYQAHYEENKATGVKVSVLAVVKNYGRLFPYISSIIMCIGILLQMIMRLPKLFKET